MDHQYPYREKGMRNIYSSYNQMRAGVECFPNQSKKLYLIGPYRPFHRAIHETFEDSGKVLAVSVS